MVSPDELTVSTYVEVLSATGIAATEVLTKVVLFYVHERAWARISRSPRSIGDLLMDQKVVAGVGNVYRAEALFRQRLDPFRPGTSLRRGRFEALWADLVELMAEGVRTNRIDTVREDVEWLKEQSRSAKR